MTGSRPLEKPITERRTELWPLAVTGFVVGLIVAGGIVALHFAQGVTPSIEAKVLGIAIAVGLDVLALSIAVGIMQIPWGARLRLGLGVSTAEVLMQLLGYLIGNGAGHIVGTLAVYVGFAVLAGVGGFIVRDSYRVSDESHLKVDSGWGLLAVCASVSLDSLGIGISLPGVPLPLVPLLSTVGVSTLVFTAIGLAFGAQLGERYKRLAERIAGVVLIVLAAFFTAQHLLGWSA